MKNKTPVIIAVVVALFLLIGFFAFGKKSQSPGDAMTGGTQTGGTNAFTTIKDALSKSVSLQCTFTDEENRKTETFIKNGAVRSNFTGATPEDSGNMIMKDKKFYMWNAKNEGFMMEIPDETAQSGSTTGSQQGQAGSWSDTMAALEKYKDSCKPAVVSDSLFTPPATVQFQDYSQMIKQLQQTVPTAGADSQPGGYDQKQVEEMMKQYQTAPAEGQ